MKHTLNLYYRCSASVESFSVLIRVTKIAYNKKLMIVNKIVLINISETINDNSKAIPDSIYRYIIISTKILFSYFGAQMY